MSVNRDPDWVDGEAVGLRGDEDDTRECLTVNIGSESF